MVRVNDKQTGQTAPSDALESEDPQGPPDGDRKIFQSDTPQASVAQPQAAPPRRWRQTAAIAGICALISLGSAAAGAVLGVALTTATASDESRPALSLADLSLSDLWQRGVRYDVSRPINLLLMGVDQVADDAIAEAEGADGSDVDAAIDPDEVRFAGRSDTMLLARLDPEAKTVSMLSIPRDTLVEFPGRSGVTKINHANLLGGPKLTAEVISHNFQDVEIDRYVRFNTAAFRNLVNLLGGVDVFVPHDMEYTDETQGLYIDLKAGQQRLDGDQAEQFARFRGDGNGDIGRVQRQQILLGALRDRLESPQTLTKIPALVSLLREEIDTNLSGEELLALLDFGTGLTRADIEMVMLPGQFSRGDRYYASYWVPEPEDVERIMRDYFKVGRSGRFSPDVADRISLTPEAMADSEPVLEAKRSLRIAVQSASEQPYVAQQMAQHLREDGFERVYVVPDWPTAQAQTQIIAQRGDTRKATILEQAVGLGTVVASSTGDLTSDITIRVGEDWSTRLDI